MNKSTETDAEHREVDKAPDVIDEVADLHSVVNSLRDEQVQLRTTVITLRNDIAVLAASQEKLRDEMQTKIYQQRVVLDVALEDLRIVADTVVQLATAAAPPGVTAVSEDTGESEQ